MAHALIFAPVFALPLALAWRGYWRGHDEWPVYLFIFAALVVTYVLGLWPALIG